MEQILSREEYPELYAAIAKAYGPMPTNRVKNVTEDEAIDYLNTCKVAYMTAIKESDRAELVSQYRFEIRYWEDYLHANWPEERAKREPFGGKTEPMTKEQLREAMTVVYARMQQVSNLGQSKNLDPDFMWEIQAALFGAMKTLAAVVDEMTRKMPDSKDEHWPSPAPRDVAASRSQDDAGKE